MQFVCVWFDLHSDMPFGCTLFAFFFSSTFSCMPKIVNKFHRTRITHILELWESAVSKVNTETKFPRIECAPKICCRIGWFQLLNHSIGNCTKRRENENEGSQNKKKLIRDSRGSRSKAHSNEWLLHTHTHSHNDDHKNFGLSAPPQLLCKRKWRAAVRAQTLFFVSHHLRFFLFCSELWAKTKRSQYIDRSVDRDQSNNIILNERNKSFSIHNKKLRCLENEKTQRSWSLNKWIQ